MSDTPFASNDLTTTLNTAGVFSQYFGDISGQKFADALINRSGRYVRVWLAGSAARYLLLNEVQVFSGTSSVSQNLALSKLASASQSHQSCDDWGCNTYHASYAIDNALTNNWLSYGSQAWLQVDLGESRVISAVQLWNAWNGAGCSYTICIGDVYLMLSEQPITTTNLGTALGMSGVVTAYLSSTGTQSYTLPINAVARYARLWFANTNYSPKAVAEMRVFGAPTPSQQVSKYYFLGKQRVAMRQNGKLTYLHGDQLGSASLATDAAGTTLSQQRYLPYGGLRWAQSGSVFPTDWQYTDQQRQNTHLTGIRSVEYYDYRARMYDPKIGRFISPDSVVPDEKNPQSLNRYMYTLGNPLKFTDPDGHCSREADDWCYENHPQPETIVKPKEIVIPDTISSEGEDLIRKWEGNHNTPYNDPVGHCTIGVGHLLHTGACGSSSDDTRRYSEEEIKEMLRQDISKAIITIKSYVKVSLSQGQLDALVSFVFNFGSEQFLTSNLLQYLNSGNYEGAANEFSKWVWARDATTGEMVKLPGLVARRREEETLFRRR